ncbi:MAG TPA: patatin-like phospholipase family protein [Thermoanaerobaculia bacterium]|nr:patatin-like phospholipase family protein [Thermoanaerobaculia bacterium]
MAATKLFGGLSAAAHDEIAGELEWCLVPGGTRVCRQGDPAGGLDLVVSGRLVAVRELRPGEETVVGQRGRGDSLGEISLLTGSPHSATVRALRDTVLARLSRERSESLLRRYPDVLFALTRLLASQLRVEPNAPARGLGCVAVAVAAAGPEVPLADFVDRLAASLAALGPTLRVNARDLDARFGAGAAESPDGSPEHRQVTAWMDEQEARHEVVLYEAEAATSAWTRRCLRQADRVLVVAQASPPSAVSPPTLGPLAAELARLETEQGRQLETLVLLHRSGEKNPRGTSAWLALRPFRRHHHVRLDRSADVDRVASFLAGRPVGLVLGGGGARSFAHIGVIRALEEAGIPIDRIGGTSMGGIIAAQYARGYTWQEMLDLNRRGWVEMKPHKLYTLPLISLLSSRIAHKMLDMMYGDDEIEDLWLGFYCVSANMTRTERCIHRQGSVHFAVGCSMAIPGVTPPIFGAEGDLLVDGGVLDNLPTGVMRSHGPGPIIAVDVSATVDLETDPSYRRTPGPWEILKDRLRRRAKVRPFPNILRIVQRSALLASDVYAKQSKPDVELYLDLPMEGYDMFDMDALPALAEFGYRFTRETLERDPQAIERLRLRR